MWTAVGIAVFTLLVVAIVFNSLIAKKNAVENAFGGVDAQLKKRYDLIPNLVETVKGYARHEEAVFAEVSRLRARAMSGGLPTDEVVALNNVLGRALGGIMIVAEDYPDLKASGDFVHLQRTLNEIEEQISAARRAYNAAVTDHNNAVEMFPTNMVAHMMGYTRRQYFETPQDQRSSSDVAEGL